MSPATGTKLTTKEYPTLNPKMLNLNQKRNEDKRTRRERSAVGGDVERKERKERAGSPLLHSPSSLQY